MFLGDMEGKVLLGSVHRADDATGRNCATSEDAFSLRDEKLTPSFHGFDRVDGHLDGLGRPHPTLVARVVETGQVSFRRVSPASDFWRFSLTFWRSVAARADGPTERFYVPSPTAWNLNFSACRLLPVGILRSKPEVA